MAEHTKDKLAAALREVGLTEMADKAATGYYHNFLSPLEMPELLLHDLARAAAVNRDDAKNILDLRRRAVDGDFADGIGEWAKSEEGQLRYAAVLLCLAVSVWLTVAHLC